MKYQVKSIPNQKLRISLLETSLDTFSVLTLVFT